MTLREVVVVVVTRAHVLAAVGNVVVEVTVAAGNAGGVFRLTSRHDCRVILFFEGSRANDQPNIC